MAAPKKSTKKVPVGTSVPATMMPVDGKMALANCTLQQALHSVYCTFASVLGGYHIPRSTKLFEEDIPGMVYDVAVGAGWLPFPPGKETAGDNFRLHGKQVLRLGDFTVERWYRDSFMAALDYWIGFHTEDHQTRKRRIANLPPYTSKEERKTLLDTYLRREVEANMKKQYLDPVSQTAQPKMTEIARRAGVDYSDFNKWRRGPDVLKDSSKKSIHIALLLRYDERCEPKKQIHRAQK